jgi:hypothetical protein
LIADNLKEKLIKIGAKVVSHGRYVAFQMGPRSPIRETCSPTSCGWSPSYAMIQSQDCPP